MSVSPAQTTPGVGTFVNSIGSSAFRTLFDAAPDFAFIVDAGTGEVLEVNEAALGILGLARDAVVGRPVSALGGGFSEASYERRRGERRRSGELTHSRAQYIRPDGSPAVLDLSSREIEVDGRLLTLATGRTADDPLPQEDASSSAAPAHHLSRPGEWAANIAHDLNNYLAAALGNIDMLLLDGGEEPAQELLDARAAVKDCAALVADFVAHSRDGQTAREPVEPGHAIAEAVRLTRPILGPGVHVKLDDRTAGATFMADPLQVQRVLVNLLVNAGTAMDHQGVIVVTAEFVTAAGRADARMVRCVRLAVGDSGPGVEPGLRERIFEPYFTTGQRGKATGLGLSIVASIVAAHGGWMELDCPPGEGACFSAYFPG